jgi:hypothetical protein
MTLLIADETARVLRVPRWIEEGGQALPGGWRRNAQRGLSIKDATT